MTLVYVPRDDERIIEMTPQSIIENRIPSGFYPWSLQPFLETLSDADQALDLVLYTCAWRDPKPVIYLCRQFKLSVDVHGKKCSEMLFVVTKMLSFLQTI